MTSFEQYRQIGILLAPSLATGAAIAVGGSVCGVFAILRREALMALVLPQIVAVGAAAGLRLGIPTLPPALIAVTAAVILLTLGQKRTQAVWLLPSLYIAGLSLAFLIIANAQAHVAELQSLFTGIDVAVSPEDAIVAVPLILAPAALVVLLWRRWLLLACAPASAELAGLSPFRWNLLFLLLLSLVLLAGTDALGLVMVIAMLFLPAASVLPWVRRLPAALIGAAALGLLFLLAGFVLSVEMDWPLSQSVGGAGFATMALSNLAKLAKGES